MTATRLTRNPALRFAAGLLLGLLLLNALLSPAEGRGKSRIISMTTRTQVTKASRFPAGKSTLPRRPSGAPSLTSGAQATNALSNIEVKYPANIPASAKTAVEYAASIWEANVSSAVPISVTLSWSSLGSGVLGQNSALSVVYSGSPYANTYYPLALANKLLGYDLSPSNPDMQMTLSSDYSWYYGTDGNTPAGQTDLVSVVLHELGHGLGFSGSGSVDGSGNGTLRENGFPYIWDQFTIDAGGTALLSYTSPSASLGNALRSNAVYFNGSYARAANGGSNVALYAPAVWQGGSSYSHLAESFNTSSGGANSLMTYSLGTGQSIHSPGAVALAMLEDMGWTTSASPTPTITRTPTRTTTMTTTPLVSATPADAGNGDPYGGTAWTVPGTVEAENFNTGGQGVGYNDLDTTNTDGLYRPGEGVDIGTASTGGYQVQYMQAGEWLKYTLNVTQSGVYTVKMRIRGQTSTGTGAGFRAEVGGYNLNSTGLPALSSWVDTSVNIPLNAGQQVMRIYAITNGSDGYVTVINFISFTLVSTATPTTQPTSTQTSVPTSTRTATSVPTATSTATSTRTATSVPTATSTATSTRTATSVPTATQTAVPTSTQTSVPTSTRTATSVPTSTRTATDVPTATQTAVPTATQTAVPTSTRTATDVPTHTATSVPTSTQTSVPTSTQTTLPTHTQTSVPTNTQTSVPTSSQTTVPTHTRTATNVPTSTQTSVPTQTHTSVPTSTRTATSVPTQTHTSVPTHAETSTPTSEPAETPTQTATTTSVPTAGPTYTTYLPLTAYDANTISGAINRLFRQVERLMLRK